MKKKALVVLLAVAMVFTFASAAMAASFSDMSTATKATQTAVTRLTGLGVINGYTDGTFGPNNNIRRDEFAKIAASAAGFASSADSMKNQSTGYTDAAKGIWSTGYINVVSAQGYMKGYNGKFSPAANITNAEVLTTVLRMYGYNDNLTGPWPINYVNQAVKDGITDDVVNFSSGALATRGNVAVMVSAALNQNMMEYSKDTESFQEKEYANGTTTVAKTLYEIAFGGERVEKALIAGLVVDQYDAEDGLSYSFYVDANGNGTKDTTELAFKADANTVVTGAPFYGIGDKYATIVYKTKGADNKVSAINVTSSTVNFTQLERTGNAKVKVNDTTTYSFRTGFEYADASDAVADALTATGKVLKASALNENGTISLDYDGKVYAIKADVDGTAGTMNIVTKIDTAKEKIALKAGSLTAGNWDDLEKVVIMKDGKIVAPADLKAGDVLSYKANGRVAVVTTGAVTGVVGNSYKIHSSTTYNQVAIGGTKYTIAADNTDNPLDYINLNGTDYTLYEGSLALLTVGKTSGGLGDNEVTFYKDGKNQIALVIYGETTTTMYGVMMGADTNNSDDWGNASQINSYTIFNNEGKTVTYNVTSDYNDNPVADLHLGSVVAYVLDSDGNIDSISSIDTATYTDPAYFDVSNNKYITLGSSKYALSNDAVILNMTADGTKLKVETVSASSFLADDVTYSALTVGATGSTQTVVPFSYNVNRDGDVNFVAIANFGGSSTDNYALVEDMYSDVKGVDYIKFSGNDTAYKVGSVTMTGIAIGDVVDYDLANGALDAISEVSLTKGDSAWKVVAGVNGTLVTISDTEKYEVASDAKIFVYGATGYTMGTTEDVVKGAAVSVLGTTNSKDEYTSILVISEKDRS